MDPPNAHCLNDKRQMGPWMSSLMVLQLHGQLAMTTLALVRHASAL
jgi:hypothetical protein